MVCLALGSTKFPKIKNKKLFVVNTYTSNKKLKHVRLNLTAHFARQSVHGSDRQKDLTDMLLMRRRMVSWGISCQIRTRVSPNFWKS